MRPHVDHSAPRKAFHEAIEGGLLHVLTIRALSGKGKSRLIGSFRQDSRDRAIPVALLDFKALRGRDIFALLALLRSSLQRLNFSNYDAALARYVSSSSPSVTLENIHMFASSLGDITAGDMQRRRALIQSLTDDIVKDIETHCSAANIVVMLIDTFEQADEDTKSWISGQLIPIVCDVTGLVLVVAGQQTPQIDPAHWGEVYRHFDLPEGLEWLDWLQYANEIGALEAMPEEVLRKYHAHYKGDPKFMCQVCDPLGYGAV